MNHLFIKKLLFGSREVFKELESLNSVEKSCFNSHVLNYISLKIFYFCLIFYSSLEDLLIDFRGRETEGEREGEKHWPVAFSTFPYQGPNPQPRRGPRQRIEPVTLHFAEQCPTNRATPARAKYFISSDPCHLQSISWTLYSDV